MTPSLAQKPTNGGTPARLNIRISHHAGEPRAARVQALEVVELVGLEALARQQQDHAEAPPATIDVADHVEHRGLIALRPCRRGSRAA